MDIYTKLAQEFTTEEQKLFVDNFRSYLNYDQDKDYVIDFEKAAKIIGFTRKNNAKKILIKYFNENNDYKIENLLLQAEHQDNLHGGHNKEIIKMTPNAFKDFCMKANTENAHRIRKYYIKMESILFKHLNQTLIETQTQLKTANDKIKLLENKSNKKKFEVGDNVYIVKDFTQEDVYKVGSTNNLNTRNDAYYSHNSSKGNCRIIYSRKCKDRNVLEKVVHHKLKQYSYDYRHDWFNTDFDTIRNCIDLAQLTLDEEDLGFKLESISPTEVEEEEVNPLEINNPNDFQKFIDECCKKENESVGTTWIEINSKYRLWARATSNNYKEALNAYLYNNGFKKGSIYDEKTKTNSQAFYGISIIQENPIILPESPSEIEKFIYQNFKSLVTGRVSSMDIFNKFIEYKNEYDPEYTKLLLEDKRKITDYFQKHFFGSLIHDGDRRRYGYYGVSLLGEVSESIGKRINLGNRKGVQQIDPITNEVIKSYKSITEACASLGIQISKLSNAIKSRKICNDYIFIKE